MLGELLCGVYVRYRVVTAAESSAEKWGMFSNFKVISRERTPMQQLVLKAFNYHNHSLVPQSPDVTMPIPVVGVAAITHCGHYHLLLNFDQRFAPIDC